MKITSILADIVVNQDGNTIQNQALYGTPQTGSTNVVPIIAVSAVCFGIIVGIIVLVKKSLKKKNDINNAQALYGPPPNLAKRYKVEPPEDLYGCPRPDDMDEEPNEIDEENGGQ